MSRQLHNSRSKSVARLQIEQTPAVVSRKRILNETNGQPDILLRPLPVFVIPRNINGRDYGRNINQHHPDISEIQAIQEEIAALHARNTTLSSQSDGCLLNMRIEDIGVEDRSKLIRYMGEILEGQREVAKDLAQKESELMLKTKILQDKRMVYVEWPKILHEEKVFLNDDRMHFVNRELAVKQLLHVHNSTHNRSFSESGKEWLYALCANDYGCGKSEFARNYVAQLSKLEGRDTSSLTAYPVVKQAVTIHIRLSRVNIGQSGKQDIAAHVLDCVKDVIRRKSLTFIEFSTSPRSLTAFMQTFVERSPRPIFLVLDEVGAPFYRSESRAKMIQAQQLVEFKEFIKEVIIPLLPIPRLFLLLCGKAPFLDWVGTNTQEKPIVGGASTARTRRIVLNMISPVKIVKILQHTLYKWNGKESTLQDFLNLTRPNGWETSQMLANYAERLYHATGGHPRTMCETLLERCDEIISQEIHAVKRPDFEIGDEGFLSSTACELLEETAFKFSEGTRFLLSQCDGCPKNLNLSQKIYGITYQHLLPPLRMGVEDLKNGFVGLFLPYRVRILLESYFSPLHRFLSCLDALKEVPIDFPLALELMVAKLFIQLFSSGKKPSDIEVGGLRLFETPVFGNWDNFACDIHTKRFPKVTDSSGRFDGRGYTVRCDRAKDIIAKSFFQLPEKGLWLLPRPLSSSPDLMHISNSTSGKRIVCIAVKNYSEGSSLSLDNINKEIEIAERMIPGDDYCAVLIVACMNYHESILKNFSGNAFQVYSSDAMKKLREIILLNLTSTEWRARFCGYHQAETVAGFEILVSKTRGPDGFKYLGDDLDSWHDAPEW